METLFVKENFNIRWFAQAGFVENINSILKEYKQSRRLLVTITTSCLSFWFKQSKWNFWCNYTNESTFSNVWISKFKFFFNLFFFLATPRSLRDPSSPTRDQTRAPCSESVES